MTRRKTNGVVLRRFVAILLFLATRSATMQKPIRAELSVSRFQRFANEESDRASHVVLRTYFDRPIVSSTKVTPTKTSSTSELTSADDEGILLLCDSLPPVVFGNSTKNDVADRLIRMSLSRNERIDFALDLPEGVSSERLEYLVEDARCGMKYGDELLAVYPSRRGSLHVADHRRYVRDAKTPKFEDVHDDNEPFYLWETFLEAHASVQASRRRHRLRCTSTDQIACGPQDSLADLLRTISVRGANATNIETSPHGVGLCPASNVPFGEFQYYPGRLRWLRREYNTKGAEIVGSLGGILAGPSSFVSPIVVYGWNSGLDFDRIWMSSAFDARRFVVGEVLQLRNFQDPGNVGLFVVGGRVDRQTLRITELPTHGIPLTGRLSALAPEHNTNGATLFGCFGCVRGPSTKRAPATIEKSVRSRRGGHSNGTSTNNETVVVTWTVCFASPPSSSTERFCPLADGEIVRLVNFDVSTNSGPFRVASSFVSKERHCVVIDEVSPRDCGIGRVHWLSPERNSIGATIEVVEASRREAVVLGPSTLEQTLEIIVIRSDSDDDAKEEEEEAVVRLFGPALDFASRPVPREGDEILLRNFRESGNFGRFRVTSVVVGRLDDDSAATLSPVLERTGVALPLTSPLLTSNETVSTDPPNVVEIRLQNMSPPKQRASRSLAYGCPSHHESEGSPVVPPLIPFVRCPAPNCRRKSGPCCGGEERGECASEQYCDCAPTWGGKYCEDANVPCPRCEVDDEHCRDDDTVTYCTNHGKCTEREGACECEFGWTGVACGVRSYPCPNDCSGHGMCDAPTGKCRCDALWIDVDCGTSSLACPKSCSGHGVCEGSSGKCQCDPGWGGLGCDECDLPCPLDCSPPQGTCDPCTGSCTCVPPYSPPSCCDVRCPDDCTDETHGVCVDAKCFCRRAWTGPSCAIPKCGNHGRMAADGSCQCDEDGTYYSALPGSICDEVGTTLCSCSVFCVADRGVHDTCSGNAVGCSDSGTCLCAAGFAGRHCQLPLEPTGEVNWRNYPDAQTAAQFSDRAIKIQKATWLVYAEAAAFPYPPLAPPKPTVANLPAVRSSALVLRPKQPHFRTVFGACGTSSFSPESLSEYARDVVVEADLGLLGSIKDDAVAFNEFLAVQRGSSRPELPFRGLYEFACKYAFALYDDDVDGQVTLKELVTVVLRREGALLPASPPKCPAYPEDVDKAPTIVRDDRSPAIVKMENVSSLHVVARNCSVAHNVFQFVCRGKIPVVAKDDTVKIGLKLYRIKRVRVPARVLLALEPKFPRQYVKESDGCKSCDDVCLGVAEQEEGEKSANDEGRCHRAIREAAWTDCASTLCGTATSCVCLPPVASASSSTTKVATTGDLVQCFLTATPALAVVLYDGRPQVQYSKLGVASEAARVDPTITKSIKFVNKGPGAYLEIHLRRSASSSSPTPKSSCGSGGVEGLVVYCKSNDPHSIWHDFSSDTSRHWQSGKQGAALCESTSKLTLEGNGVPEKNKYRDVWAPMATKTTSAKDRSIVNPVRIRGSPYFGKMSPAFVTTYKNNGCVSCAEYCETGKLSESLPGATCVAAHTSSEGRSVSCEETRCGRGLTCTCLNPDRKDRTDDDDDDVVEERYGQLVRAREMNGCGASCDVQCSLGRRRGIMPGATCEVAIFVSKGGRDDPISCDDDAHCAGGSLSCVCRNPAQTIVNLELQRPYEGPSSVGVVMYRAVDKDGTENDDADATSFTTATAKSLSPTALKQLDRINAYSLRPSSKELQDAWDEVHALWVRCDKDYDLVWRPDELCECAKSDYLAMLLYSKNRRLVIEADPSSKMWCKNIPDDDPPAPPGICSVGADQTAAGLDSAAENADSSEACASVGDQETCDAMALCEWDVDAKVCKEACSKASSKGSCESMSSCEWKNARCQDRSGDDGAGGAGGAGGPGDEGGAGEGTGTDRGTTKTGYEGKDFEFGKNKGGSNLGTSVDESSSSSGGTGPYSMGTIQKGYPDEYPLDIPNPFEWCDMSNPFFNPFCPTPNPWFNILIKMMIPGAIRPFIDQIKNKLMGGEEFVIMLTKCMMPPIDGTGPRGGPPGFIETGGGERRNGQGGMSAVGGGDSSLLELRGLSAQRAQSKMKMRALERGLSEIYAEGNPQGALVPSMKERLYEQIGDLYAGTFTFHITERVSNALEQQLHHRLARTLREQLHESISHALHRTLSSTVGQAVGHTVPSMLVSLLPRRLFSTINHALSHTLTRSLTHALTGSLVSTIGRKPEQEYFCYQCTRFRRYCERCDLLSAEAITRSLRRSPIYESYFGDYYADIFTNAPTKEEDTAAGVSPDQYGRKVPPAGARR
eukprot:g3263.t1